MGQSTISVNFLLAWMCDKRSRRIGDQFVGVDTLGANATQGHIQSYDVPVPAGEYCLLWDGTTTGAIRDWTALVVLCKEGTLELDWVVSLPTSEDDLSEADAANRIVLPDSKSCVTPFCCDNNRVRMNANSSKSFGLTDNIPNVFLNEATNALYKRYQLWGWNRDTDDVVAQVGVVD